MQWMRSALGSAGYPCVDRAVLRLLDSGQLPARPETTCDDDFGLPYEPLPPETEDGYEDHYETVALILQGGGALGAYQAGVYHALHEEGIEPDWVIGTSIGAIINGIQTIIQTHY